MAKRKSQLELAVEALEAEKHILEVAIDRLREQQQSQVPRKKRAAKPTPIRGGDEKTA